MDGAKQPESLGALSPVQVVECAEGSSAVCWIRAEAVRDDGWTTVYVCCGGAGRKADFMAKSGLLSAKSVEPSDVPDGLTWSMRFV
jgi:hypothetical protein